MKTETLKSTPRTCSLWLEIYPAISHAFIYHGGQISLYTQCNKVNALIEDQQQEWTAASQEMRVAAVLAWATLTTSTRTRDSDRKQGVPSQPCGDIYANLKWQSRSKWTGQWWARSACEAEAELGLQCSWRGHMKEVLDGATEDNIGVLMSLQLWYCLMYSFVLHIWSNP